MMVNKAPLNKYLQNSNKLMIHLLLSSFNNKLATQSKPHNKKINNDTTRRMLS